MKKAIITLGTVLLLSGCGKSATVDKNEEIRIQFLNNQAEVVKEIKVDDYYISNGNTVYYIRGKSHTLRDVPIIIIEDGK
ncbi:hypothetical protein [Bacillus sp. NPDC094106]|uniref:hypothetical protein n=1 Tax=Bacillus sp. NPDC094106 TaxID=3363949 RepID=UPI00381A32A9